MNPSNPHNLSPRALALWNRLLDGVGYYPTHDPRVPKAMNELADAGLVIPMVRVIQIGSYWMPVGSIPMRFELTPRQAARGEGHPTE